MAILPLFIVLLFATLQDFFLVNYFGELARSPIFLLVPFFLVWEIKMLLEKNYKMSKYKALLLLWIVYLLVVSLAYYFFYRVVQGNPDELLGRSLFGKIFRGWAYYVVIFLMVGYLESAFDKFSVERLFKAFLVLLACQTFLGVYELITLPETIKYLHSSPYPYGRIRLTTSESSTTATLIFCLALYLAALANLQPTKTFARNFIVLSIGFLLGISYSKGLLLATALAFFAIILTNQISLKLKPSTIVVGCLSTMLILAVLLPRAVDMLQNDIYAFGSISTRLITNFSAIMIFINNPLGVGTGVYIPYMLDALEQVISFLPNLDDREVSGYFVDSNSLSAKSALFQLTILGGVGGLLFFLTLNWFAYRDIMTIRGTKKSPLLAFAFFGMFVSISAFVNYEIKYEVWVAYALLGSLSRRIESDHR